MTVNDDILDAEFTNFVDFIQLTSGNKFETFATSKYLNDQENYKYKVYEEARDNLANKYWKPEDIGTGRIQKKVISAIKAKVNYNYEMVVNNLVNWRQQDTFAKTTNNEKLEATLFYFYKGHINDGKAFEQFMSEGLSYQFIAYLFFIKERRKYLPISQERFDKIFKQIGVSGFKTSGNVSWENYSEFCSIIKQVQTFLKTKDKDASLLDAHSFLWILGNEMQEIKELPINSHEKITAVKENMADNALLSNADKLVKALKKTRLLDDAFEQIGLVEKTDYPDALTDIDNASNTISSLPEKDREIYTKARIGQGMFRESLINHWQQACSVTGCEQLNILIASHIKPWRDCTPAEAINGMNGLLLIPNLDSLFDKGFISFDDDGSILFSTQLSSAAADQLGVKKNMRLHHRHMRAQHQQYLEFHRTNIFRKTS